LKEKGSLVPMFQKKKESTPPLLSHVSSPPHDSLRRHDARDAFDGMRRRAPPPPMWAPPPARAARRAHERDVAVPAAPRRAGRMARGGRHLPPFLTRQPPSTTTSSLSAPLAVHVTHLFPFAPTPLVLFLPCPPTCRPPALASLSPPLPSLSPPRGRRPAYATGGWLAQSRLLNPALFLLGSLQVPRFAVSIFAF
jgi:hypothetical protein